MFAVDRHGLYAGTTQNITRNALHKSNLRSRPSLSMTRPNQGPMQRPMQVAHSTPLHRDGVYANHSCNRSSSSKPHLGSQDSSSRRPCTGSRPCPLGSTTSTSIRHSSHRTRHGERDSIIVHSASAGQNSSGEAKPSPSLLQSVLKVVNAQILPILLITAMLVGSCCPSLGAAAAKTSLATYTTTAVFVLAGLSIKRGEAQEAFKYSGETQGTLSGTSHAEKAAGAKMCLPHTRLPCSCFEQPFSIPLSDEQSLGLLRPF